MSTHAPEAQVAIDAVWRIESARLIASLARVFGDVGLAEDLAQEALVKALELWPEAGVPDSPGAWLMTTARNRGIDRLRRDKRLQEKYRLVGRDLELEQSHGQPDLDAELDDRIGDDLLSLIFTACHPVLSKQARLALTLRMLGGLSTEEIARAFLQPKATVAQRIVRAKKTLAEKQVRFEVPQGEELERRLPTVLEVVYLIFNEGYATTSGDDWVRADLCEEAMRLGRILAELAPEEPEVHGLIALMEIQASRIRARLDPDGRPILLMDQDRTRWDRLLIRRGLAALERAEALEGPHGPYVLQAAIAACHARAVLPEETDWARIAALYALLSAMTENPVIELNRAVAVSMAEGPAAGLEIVDRLAGADSLTGYHLLHAVRGDLVEKLGRREEAASDYRRAAGMTENARERQLLLERAERCEAG